VDARMTVAATVRLTPEQREELGQAIGRLIVWLARVLHVPWWASLLLLFAILAGALVAAVWRPRKRPATRPRPRMAVDKRPVHDFVFCGHCGHIVPPARRATSNRIPLCYTSADDPRNCFKLVTAQGHKPDGPCCQGGRR
jgi:hypothetical protein